MAKESKEYLTKEKFAELKKELENLKNVKRKEIAESLEYAKSLGDLSENAEYHEAREMQATLEERISKLESILQSAVIMAEYHGDTVSLGSTVTLEKKGGDKKIWQIVGSEESNTTAGKLSHRSPIGESVMGKKKSDTVTVSTPGGKVSYTIVDIK